jgi:hypothetical protein
MNGRVVIDSDGAVDMQPGEVWPFTTLGDIALTAEGFRIFYAGRAASSPMSREVFARMLASGAAALEEYDRMAEERAAVSA